MLLEVSFFPHEGFPSVYFVSSLMSMLLHVDSEYLFALYRFKLNQHFFNLGL
jgi:hypothetical protein